MENVRKFIKLDIMSIKPYITLKNLMIYLGIGVLMIYSNKSISTGIGMIMVFVSIYASYPFAIGDQNGIDALYVLLGLNRKEVVTGRYLFLIIINLLGSVIAVILSIAVSLILGLTINVIEIIATLSTVTFLMTVIQFIQYPIFFKLGYMNAKVYTYLPYIIVSIIFLAVVNLSEKVVSLLNPSTKLFIENITNTLQDNPVIVILIILIIWIAIFSLSKSISNKYYQRREF